MQGGPSEGYRPRGSQDGDIPPGQLTDLLDQSTSPLRQHNPFRGTVAEYDLRSDTTHITTQPTHDDQRRASQGEGPQWQPAVVSSGADALDEADAGTVGQANVRATRLTAYRPRPWQEA